MDSICTEHRSARFLYRYRASARRCGWPSALTFQSEDFPETIHQLPGAEVDYANSIKVLGSGFLHNQTGESLVGHDVFYPIPHWDV